MGVDKSWSTSMPQAKRRLPSAPETIPAPISCPAPIQAADDPCAHGDDDALRKILDKVRAGYLSARAKGGSIDVKILTIGNLDSFDAVEDQIHRQFKPREPGEGDDVFVGTVRGESKMR